jgi:hypothetical protein
MKKLLDIKTKTKTESENLGKLQQAKLLFRKKGNSLAGRK